MKTIYITVVEEGRSISGFVTSDQLLEKKHEVDIDGIDVLISKLFIDINNSKVIDGVTKIMLERLRHREVERWTEDRDKHYSNEELALAAAAYAVPPKFSYTWGMKIFNFRELLWPWGKTWLKSAEENRMRDLEKAGALIASEIDRLNSK